jgi:hypothetical protein
MADDDTLICESCEKPAPMLTEEGFCARCYWTLERAALSVRIGRAATIRVDPTRPA